MTHVLVIVQPSQASRRASAIKDLIAVLFQFHGLFRYQTSDASTHDQEHGMESVEGRFNLADSW